MALVLICELKDCMLFHPNDGVPQKEKLLELSPEILLQLRYFLDCSTEQQKDSLISLFPRVVITTNMTLKTFPLRTLVKGSIREL